MLKQLTLFPYKHSMLLGVMLLCASMSLTGCIQSKSVAATLFSDTPPISEQALKLVNHNFHATFIGGDWYYQGAQAVNGSINAYIQIPAKLNMNEQAQKRYLQQAICPAATKMNLWKELQNVPLSVHIYTMHKKFSVYAECQNPLQVQQA